MARVDIYIVSIAVRNEPDTTNTAAGWVTVAEPRSRFNLVALSAGVTDTLGGSIVPPGQYRAVRMVIDTDSSSVTAITGQRVTVDWQSSAGRPTLYALVENPIGVPDTGTPAASSSTSTWAAASWWAAASGAAGRATASCSAPSSAP